MFFPFQEVYPFKYGWSTYPPQRTLQKQGKPMDKAWSSLAGGFNYPFIFHLFLGFHDPMMTANHMFFRDGLKLNHHPAWNFWAPRPSRRRQPWWWSFKISRWVWCWVRHRRKKNNEKGKGVVWNWRLHVFFQKLWRYMFFGCKSGTHFLEGDQDNTNNSWLFWVISLPKICVVSCLGW